MKRYYYTDPLAAAWMAKHFGVRFESYFVPTNQVMDVLLPAIETHIHTGHLQIDGRFLIHPDSLSLLEPRLRDVVELDGRDQDETTVRIGGFGKEVGEDFDFYSVGLQYFDRDEVLRVIERNGLGFHWPEVEEA